MYAVAHQGGSTGPGPRRDDHWEDWAQRLWAMGPPHAQKLSWKGHFSFAMSISMSDLGNGGRYMLVG